MPDIDASNTGYQVISVTEIKVRVPAGATTGLIRVSNANGTGVSATAFAVLPSTGGRILARTWLRRCERKLSKVRTWRSQRFAASPD